MKTTFRSWALLPLILCACAHTPATKPVVEKATDLGFGFRRVALAEPVSASWESLGHFEYLYYGDQRLCQLGVCSVSPSGRYAVYQDGPSGNFFLFRPAQRRLTKLTSHFVALADSFEWHEDANSVEAHFESGHGTQQFSLQ
jgi:hypothetical protein